MSTWAPRRIECAGECGAWWYQARVGRPRRWCPRCYRRHKTLVNQGVGEAAPALGWWRRAGKTEHVSAPVARVMEQLAAKVGGER